MTSMDCMNGRREHDEISHRVYNTFEELCEDYKSGALHPGDLKPALSRHINMILQPVRDHFTNDPHAAELLKKVKVRAGC